MTDLDEARALLAQSVTALAPVEKDTENAAGLRLASVPVADRDVPAMDISAVDGYAVRAADLVKGVPLPVVFVAAAGSTPQVLGEGGAARIFTGAVVPEGADTVVAQEDARVMANGMVRLGGWVAGANIRRRGETFTAGIPLAGGRDVLTPHRVGVLATGGAATVRVVPRPRLAIVSTGNELVGAADNPAGWQVRDSNGPLLAAAAREALVAVSVRRRTGDSLAEICACLEACLTDAEVVCTSGGVSVGDFDLVPKAVAELGGEALLHRVNMRPGKSLFVGRIAGKWLVGLPGNPAAVVTCWRLFARPLIEALAGDGDAFVEEPLATVVSEVARNRSERPVLRPARLVAREGEILAVVRSWHGAAGVEAQETANALARLEAGAEVRAGGRVACYPLPWKWPA